MNWTSDELVKIGSADELQIAAIRPDGTLRKPVTIWVVRLGDDLFVRSVNGPNSAWFRGVEVLYEGHIQAGSVDKDVSFVEEVNPGLNDLIDAEYQTKYRRYPKEYVIHITSPGARSTTIKLVPRMDVPRA
jgi:hypothetical protein